MNPVPGIFRQHRYLLLALLLLCAQTAALAHAYDHNIDAPASPTCSACLTASQLTDLCLASPGHIEASVSHLSPQPQPHQFAAPAQTASARQRGPPHPL